MFFRVNFTTARSVYLANSRAIAGMRKSDVFDVFYILRKFPHLPRRNGSKIRRVLISHSLVSLSTCQSDQRFERTLMKNFLYSAERTCMPLIFIIKSLAPIFFLEVNSRLEFRLRLNRSGRQVKPVRLFGMGWSLYLLSMPGA